MFVAWIYDSLCGESRLLRIYILCYVHRLRRLVNVKPTLIQRLVSDDLKLFIVETTFKTMEHL